MKPILKSFLKPALLSVVGSGAILGPVTLTQTNKTSEINLPKLTLRDRPKIVEKELTPTLGSEGEQKPEAPPAPPKPPEQSPEQPPQQKSEGDSDSNDNSDSSDSSDASGGSSEAQQTCEEMFESIIASFLDFRLGENDVTNSDSVISLNNCIDELSKGQQTIDPSENQEQKD